MGDLGQNNAEDVFHTETNPVFIDGPPFTSSLQNITLEKSRLSRFIVDPSSKNLTTFESSKQLMQVVSDAFTAHQQAYEKYDFVHGDISGSNIAITSTGGGVLYDWDLRHDEDDSSGSRNGRVGTRRFMSTLRLNHQDKPHTVQDDIESFLHVVLYHGFRYLRTDMAIHSLTRYIKDIFDDRRSGQAKKTMIVCGASIDFGGSIAFEGNILLTQWMNSAFSIVWEWLEYELAARRPPTPEYYEQELPRHLFPRRARYIPKPEDLDLWTHDAFASIFHLVLSRPDWPEVDPVVDIFLVSARAKRRREVSYHEESESEEDQEERGS